jgi:hypothetical protein
MSNYVPSEDETLQNLSERIERAISQNTNDFNQLTEILGFDPKTDFAEGNLSEFDLQNASLAGGDFNHTRFDQANLSGANLKDANLKGANSSNADLSDADLSNANLNGSNLRDANLAVVRLDGTNLKGANLANAQNLPAITVQLLNKREEPERSRTVTDSELRVLAENFCGQAKNTSQGKIAAYKLLRAIQSLPKLQRSYQPETSYFNQDFEEFLNETLMEVIERICEEFQADEANYIHSLVNWMNYKLRLSFKPKDRLREASRHKTFSLDRYIGGEENNNTFLDLLNDSYEDGEKENTIDSIIEQEQQARRQRWGQQVWQALHNDPDIRRELESYCSKKHHLCQCHFLMTKRLLTVPPTPWKTIAAELSQLSGSEIPWPAIQSHWRRKCESPLKDIALKLEKNLSKEVY